MSRLKSWIWAEELLTPHNSARLEAFLEGSARLAALLRLQNAGQGVPRRRNVRPEVSRMAVFARPAALPAEDAGPAVCQKSRYIQIISLNLSFFWKCRSYSGMLSHRS
jgi:hypothetical protein